MELRHEINAAARSLGAEGRGYRALELTAPPVGSFMNERPKKPALMALWSRNRDGSIQHAIATGRAFFGGIFFEFPGVRWDLAWQQNHKPLCTPLCAFSQLR